MTGWNGVFVPAGTSGEIVRHLIIEINGILLGRGFKAKVPAAAMIRRAGGASQEFGAFLQTNRQRSRGNGEA